MGGKFYVSIHVSFANACVSKGYANGEWFGFGVICATIFCALILTATMPTGNRLGKRNLPPFPVCPLIAPRPTWPDFGAIALRSSVSPPVLTHTAMRCLGPAFSLFSGGGRLRCAPRLRRTSRPPMLTLALFSVPCAPRHRLRRLGSAFFAFFLPRLIFSRSGTIL